MDRRQAIWRTALRIGAALLVALILQLALAGDARARDARVPVETASVVAP